MKQKRLMTVLLILLLMFVYELLSYTYIRVLPSLLGPKLENFFIQNMTLSNAIFAVIILLLIIPLILYFWKRDRGEEPFLYLRSFTSRDLLKGLILMMGSYGITSLWFILIDFLAPYIPFLDEAINSYSNMFSFAGAEPYVILLADIVILGPIMEELYMRGLLGGLLKRAFPFWAVVVINGLLFGIFHMNFIQAVYTSVFGAFMAALYLDTKSLSLVIVIHMIHNLLSTLPEGAFSESFAYYLDKVSLFFIPLGIYVFITMLKRGARRDKIKKEELEPFLE